MEISKHGIHCFELMARSNKQVRITIACSIPLEAARKKRRPRSPLAVPEQEDFVFSQIVTDPADESRTPANAMRY